MTEISGSTVLLTGATGGLGPALARALASENARLVLTGRRDDALRALAAELSTAGAPEPACVAADLRDRHDLTTLVDRAERAAGPVDILVHNAAVDACAAFEQVTSEELNEVVAVNLVAPLELTRSAIGGMLERGRGHVVFVSSLSGFAGTAFEAPYAATKGALNALSRSLRAEYEGRPVEFSLVAPGSVAGEGMFARGQRDGIEVPPALRLTTPEAVGRAVVAAVRDDSPELLVYPGPIKPALMLGTLAPRLSDRLNARLGLATLFRAAAEARARATTQGGPS
jgi:short-subunit dehydrogenase